MLTPYSLLWKAARPLLRRHKRLRQGFEQRLVPSDWPGAPISQSDLPSNLPTANSIAQNYFDLWIQAASGGESYLAWELLRVLSRDNPGLRVLCTTCTSQGLEILRQAKAALETQRQAKAALETQRQAKAAPETQRQAQNAPEPAPLAITLNYLPLDEPAIMKRAVEQVFGPQPSNQNIPATDRTENSAASYSHSGGRLLILLETEIWPGLLAACRAAGVRVLILNARMTEGSYRAYRLLAPWLRPLAPDAILATGEDDLKRFCQIFDSQDGQNKNTGENGHYAPLADEAPVGSLKVGQKQTALRDLMPNIKFDRLLLPLLAPSPCSLHQDTPVLVLGSVREEEEADLARAVESILRKMPQLALVIAPRHMHRVQAWSEQLAAAGLDFCLRSKLTDNNDFSQIRFLPGRIYLWDVFGELGKLYSQADAVFVGGSLAPLGGQNFLEPLAYGLVPCIGPSWSNFSWVGRELFDLGLARQVQSAEELVPALLELLTAPRSRDEVLNDFRRYLKPRQGGTLKAADLIQSYL
ncbi:MAG: hypothetical protein LBV80_05735 [Deltaproteobacteria bacterium]|nr:hypothetical protein [Deltaproteobacteria bacterium]